MSENKYQPRKEEIPKLTEEEIKEKTLIIEHGGWVFHYSYGRLLLVLPR